MKFTEQQKEEVYYKYIEHINNIADDLENKTHPFKYNRNRKLWIK